MWMDVTYEPGTLKVIAFDDAGKAVAEKIMITAGTPSHLKLEADRQLLTADGEDLSFITVTIVDSEGNPCPAASNRLHFKVEGKGVFRAVCNGDATSLEMFHQPSMQAFNGKLVVLVQSATEPGDIRLTVSGEGIEEAIITLRSEYLFSSKH
jgi:beta-galactosidase